MSHTCALPALQLSQNELMVQVVRHGVAQPAPFSVSHSGEETTPHVDHPHAEHPRANHERADHRQVRRKLPVVRYPDANQEDANRANHVDGTTDQTHDRPSRNRADHDPHRRDRRGRGEGVQRPSADRPWMATARSILRGGCPPGRTRRTGSMRLTGSVSHGFRRPIAIRLRAAHDQVP